MRETGDRRLVERQALDQAGEVVAAVVREDRPEISIVLGGDGLIVRNESRRSFSRHYHDEYGFGLMLSGAHRSASGRGQVEAVSGNVISVNPGEVHDGHPISDSRRWWMIYLHPSVIAASWRECGGEGDCELQYPARDDPGSAGLLVELARRTRQADCDRSGVDELLMMLVARIGRLRGLRSPVQDGTRLADAQALIDADPSRTVRLQDLAEVCGLSRFQVLRGFVRRTGLTPHAYQVQQRLHLARDLLRRGEALAHVAVAAGFADQSHLNRRFIRVFGYTPGAFARAVR